MDIEKAIDKLSSNSAGGPDGFPAILLKKCKLSLSKHIYSLWRESMDQGQVPLLLKQATITPVHKGGSLKTIGQYPLLPISLRSLKEYSVKKLVKDHVSLNYYKAMTQF